MRAGVAAAILATACAQDSSDIYRYRTDDGHGDMVKQDGRWKLDGVACKAEGDATPALSFNMH